MKPILLLVGALIAAVVVGCGPAVGRAVGDTDTAAGNATANIDVNVDQQLGDFKKEQDEQIQTVTKDFRSEVKETQILFSKQEEEFYALKNAIDSLETELAIVKEMPKPVPDQPDMGFLKIEAFDEELRNLHSRIDSLEETASYLQSFLVNLDERADQIQHTVEHLASEPRPNIENDLEMLRMEIEAQLNAVVDHTNSLAGVLEQLDTETQESLAGLSEEISTMGTPVYPISRDHQLAYDNSDISVDKDGQCTGPSNLRNCIDDIMGETDISGHRPEGKIESGAYQQMQVTFQDVCTVERLVDEIEASYGKVYGSNGYGANYSQLYDANFISEVEWDLIKYLTSGTHPGYC